MTFNKNKSKVLFVLSGLSLLFMIQSGYNAIHGEEYNLLWLGSMISNLFVFAFSLAFGILFYEDYKKTIWEFGKHDILR